MAAINRVLVIRNSVSGAESFSNKGISKALDAIKAVAPTASVVERDLVENPVPLFSKEAFAAIRMGKLDTPAQCEAARLSDELINEIKTADVMIIGLPRYNFGAPASFKAYIDYVARPRITFQYGANGPEGLLPNIPVWCVMSAGGLYEPDHYDAWVGSMLPFIGLKDITYLPVKGTAMGKGDEALSKLDALLEAAVAKLK